MSAAASRASARGLLGMEKVLAYDPYLTSSENGGRVAGEKVELDELFKPPPITSPSVVR